MMRMILKERRGLRIIKNGGKYIISEVIGFSIGETRHDGMIGKSEKLGNGGPTQGVELVDDEDGNQRRRRLVGARRDLKKVADSPIWIGKKVHASGVNADKRGRGSGQTKDYLTSIFLERSPFFVQRQGSPAPRLP